MTPSPFSSITALAEALRSEQTSSEAVTDQYLSRIAELDPRLNAYLTVTEERARAHARAADLARASGAQLGPLHGIPYAAKDIFNVAGMATTAGTRMLAENLATANATVVEQLERAGMVLLGKTNTVQFAYGGAGINHDHGTPHNPWDQAHRLPGGSSSGSGVAVAGGLAPIALGTDTGGSVRIPASLCGITGLKTTVGRVSRAGVYPLSWSLDSVGPLCHTVEDAALLYECIRGSDPADPSTMAPLPHQDLSGMRRGVTNLRVGIARSVFWEDVEPDVESAIHDAAEVFANLGARVFDLPFEQAEQARSLNPRGLVIAAEAYTLNRRLIDQHFADLDPIVAHRMAKGKEITAWEYLQSTLDWQSLRAHTVAALTDVDVMLCPTTAITARLVEAVDNDDAYAEANLLYLRNTAIGNILDLCGLSVPCGFSQEGLPIGLMIYAKPFEEHLALRAGYAYQSQTEWHLRTPSLNWTTSTA